MFIQVFQTLQIENCLHINLCNIRKKIILNYFTLYYVFICIICVHDCNENKNYYLVQYEKKKLKNFSYFKKLYFNF